MGKLFGTDGMRAVVGDWPLVPDFVLKLGFAVGNELLTFNQNPVIVIGRDTRSSGQMLQTALTTGLLASGVDVIDAGVIPTSAIAYLIQQFRLQAGAVLSASHNPAEQNGVKFFDQNSLKLPEAVEERIEARLLSDQPIDYSTASRRTGKLTDGVLLQEMYIQGLLAEHDASSLQGLRLLIDCSNGAASYVAPMIFGKAGAVPIVVHASPTGDNINLACGSEMVRRSPQTMSAQIKQHQAHFGLAFDGDADRVVFVDEEGSLIDGDHILGFLARYLMKNNTLLGNAVVTTNMRNTGLKHFLEETGLLLYETPVGDKYVVDKLLELRRENQGPDLIGLGGEQAGHIDLVNDQFMTGDGIRTALFVLRAYLESGAPSLASFAKGIGKTPQIIASAYVGKGPRLDKQALKNMEESALAEHAGLTRVNLRYSGTEPQLRIMIEADYSRSETDLGRIAWRMCRVAQAYANSEDGFIDILNCTRGGVILPEAGW
jgi:phosphoglucosamine mutase